MTITGTSHFNSLSAAYAYYAPYGSSVADVNAKIKAEEIHIGPPAAPKGSIVKANKEGRYVIETK